MALVKLGALVTQVSGKIGGSVFGSSLSGSYVRNIGTRTKVGTNPQQVVKARTGNLSQLWKGLTIAQQQLWANQTASYPYINRLGETKTYSPYILYQKLNQGRLITGQAVLSVPNPVDKPALVTDLTPDNVGAAMDIASQSVIAADYGVLFATQSLSKGITNPKKFLRQVIVLTGTELSNGKVYTTEYTNVFTPLNSGERYWVGLKVFSGSSGYSSGIIFLSSKDFT